MRTAARARLLRRALPYVLLLGAAGAVLRVGSAWTPRPRADFVFNNGAEVQSLDPANVTGIPAGRILRHLYEGLTVKNPRTLEPEPGQALDWQVDEDGRSYAFRLRPDATWTNGDPVTADDFVWSYRRLLHPATAATYAYLLWYVQGAEAYSTWPGDLAGTEGAWVRSVAGQPAARGERLRFGLTHDLIHRVGDVAGSIEIDPGLVGTPVAAGDALGQVVGQATLAFEAPVTGRVVAINADRIADPNPVARSPLDPDNWLVEVELVPRGANDLRELKSGERYREDVLWPKVGIRARNPRVLVFELLRPTPYFLDLLSFHALFPVNRRAFEEARERWPDRWQIEWTRPENLVTNGPFTIVERRVNDRIRMAKNPRYWDARSVAFRTVEALAIDRATTAVNLYLTGACDWISGTIPPTVAGHLKGREDFRPEPFLGTYFYRINVTKPPLDDPLVRRALALSVDREAICERVTQGGQYPARGLVPPVIDDWRPQSLGPGGVVEARQLLIEAGYGGQHRRLPTIELLYNTGEQHREIAEVVAESWRKVGFTVRLKNQEWKAFLDNQTNLAYDVSRSVWIGDYADPTTFLDVFRSHNENNRTGWKNPEYDRFLDRAERAKDPVARHTLLRFAERLLLEELPIIPIYYYSSQNLVNPRLGGFYPNLLDEHPPKYWYWRSDQELEERRAERQIPLRSVTAPGPRAGLYSPSQLGERAANAANAAAGGQEADGDGATPDAAPPARETPAGAGSGRSNGRRDG